jgi:signal transduction histidine kinase
MTMNRSALIFRACFQLFLVFIYIIAPAQVADLKKKEVNYRVVNWTFQQGLLYGRTNCLLKDANGFLWIGTSNGLNRFDGTGFKHYFNNQIGNQRISSNKIYSLVEDSLHNIWIGTERGMSRYDNLSDSMKNFMLEKKVALGNYDIIPFWASQDEVFCMEADSIFSSYNIHSLVRKQWCTLSGKMGIPLNVSQFIYEPRTNSVWIIPSSGSLFTMSGLFKLSLHDGKLEKYDWTCFLHILNHNHWTEGACYDRKRNSIWLNSEDGLVQFTLEDKEFHYVSGLKEKFNKGVAIQMDAQYRVWAGSYDKGIIIYDPETGFIDQPFAADSILNGQVNNMNFRLLCDREGIVWIGYWYSGPKGINQLIPMSRSVYQYPGDTKKPNSLSTSYGGDMDVVDDKVWVFAIDGLNIFDPANESFKMVRPGDIACAGKGKQIYFLTAGRSSQRALYGIEGSPGLFEYDISTKQCRPLPLLDSANHLISNLNISEYASTFNKDETIISSGNYSLIFMLHKDSSVAHLVLDLGREAYQEIATDQDHLIFVRLQKFAGGHTYSYKNGKLTLIHTVLDTLLWISIVADPMNQSLWVSLPGSLVHYDSQFNLIHSYSKEDGIPLVNVWGMVLDEQGNLWFNTELAISKLNPKTGKVSSITEKDGWKEEGFKAANHIVKDSNGEIYIYGYGGLTRVNPAKFKETYPPSSVYLKSIEINQQPFPLETGVNNLKELSLNYAQNRINIRTGIIDYFSRGKSQIRYKLGINENWQYGPSDYSIYYEALPPGQYKLLIQASNANGAFIGPEKVLLININPPWWKRTWAYLLFALALAAALWAFVRYRSRALKEKNIELEEKVIHRTKELKHSLEDLRETQTQLIQREKMASLGELTAGIAHEIQNPLNFVNNFSEVNGELIEEMEQAFDNNDLTGARDIAKDIKQNIEKVIHHGKRADGIVKGMLQHSRASTDTKEATDINALADEYLRLSFHGLRAKDKSFNASLQTSFDESIGKINIIPQDIGRVMLNLFNNAFYAVSEKTKTSQQSSSLGGPLKAGSYSPIVSVSTRKLENKVEIRVRDNGVGISQKIIDKIYQPFFTTKPTGEGTGLGLSLSYDIITKIHSGSLTVDSREAEFTEFIILLPT